MKDINIYKNLKITYFENRFASDKLELKEKAAREGRNLARTIHEEISWNDFVEETLNLKTWRTFTASDKTQYDKEKEKFDAIVFAKMLSNKGRKNTNIIAHYAIVLDIDGGMNVEDAVLDLADYEFVLYSSGGQGIKQGDRYRVVLPLDEPLSAKCYNELAETLKARFPYSDESFGKTLQLQFLPTYNKKYRDMFGAVYNKGKFLDPKKLPYVQSKSEFLGNIDYSTPKFSDDFVGRMLDALVQQNSGKMEYEERRILANRLASAGVNNSDMVRVLNAVGRPGAKHSGLEMAAMANTAYGHVMGLRKNLPNDFDFEFQKQPVAIIQTQGTKTKYDGEFNLKPNEYISDIADEMKWDDGINLLISDVGTGKTAYWCRREHVKIVAPLTCIVESNSNTNSLTNGNMATWNQIISMMKDSEECKKWILVVDEAHGLFSDYGYKHKVIKQLMKAFIMFKKVVLMSATISADYFSGLEIKKIYRVHKQSQAVKNIQTFICKKKDECLLKDLKKSTNKCIVLMNNKDLCNIFAERSGKKCLVVNADVKNTPEVIKFFKGKKMGEYECIIGTNSIVEGLSIEDNLNEVDVFIRGDLDPDRIEQFSNRFRNVVRIKNVKYYIDTKKPLKQQVDNVSEKVKAAQNLAEALTLYVSTLGSDKFTQGFVNQYRNESLDSAVYFDGNRFQVNYCMIDFDSALVREHNAVNDFYTFSQRMVEHGYNVMYPVWCHEETIISTLLHVDLKTMRDEREEDRQHMICKLADDFERGTLEDDGYHPDYDGLKEAVKNLIEAGMNVEQVKPVLMRRLNDCQYFNKLWTDYHHIDTGSSIREFVISEITKSMVIINGNEYLPNREADRIADLIATKVLREFYQGDAKSMLASDAWGSDVVICLTPINIVLNNITTQVRHLKVKQNRARSIINRYVTLGMSKQLRINHAKNRFFSIEYYSLTGVVFDKHVEQDIIADIIRKKTAITSRIVS